MSIEIVYDRRFIRTTRGIIPLVLAGSSNCFEDKRDRNGRSYMVAERHWTYFFGRVSLEMTEEQLLQYVGEFCKERPETEAFRQRNVMLQYKDVVPWYHNGIRAAASIEEYLSANPQQSFKGYVTVYQKSGDRENSATELTEYIRTTEALEQWLDKAKAYLRKVGTEENITAVYINLKFSDNKPLHMPKLPKGPVVAKYGRSAPSYVCEYKKDKQLEFTPDIKKAVIFDSTEDARAKLGRRWSNLLFVKADGELLKKRYVLKMIGGKNSGNYIKGRSSTKLYSTPYANCAMRFAYPAAAINYVQKLRERGYGKSFIGDIVMIDVEAETETILEV